MKRTLRKGAEDVTRTRDPAIFSRMLYQLSYLGIGALGTASRWSGEAVASSYRGNGGL